jgi:type I restriction enzyme S subunit
MTMPKPSGWQFVPLGQVIASAQSGFASGARDSNGVIQMRMNNVTTDGSLDWTSFIRVPATPKQLAKYRLQSGDVLFNATNSPELVGKTTAFSGHAEPVVFSNHFVRLRVDDKRLDPWYLARWLTHQQQRRVFESLCTQWVNQASVRKDDLLSLRIPLPPLPEQKRIAAILAKADRLRRLRRTALDLSDTYLQSVFVHLFGDPGGNPKEWDVVRIEKVLSKDRAGTRTGPFGSSLKRHEYVEQGIPVWGIDNVRENEFVEEGSLFITPSKYRALSRYTVEDGDILISRAGTVGRMCVAHPTQHPSIIGTNLVRVAVDTSTILPEYFTALFTYFAGRIGRLSMSSGGTAYSFVNPKTLKSLEIPLPPLSLQQQFVRVVHQFERLRAQQREAERQGEHLFQTLLHRAFRGELEDPKGLGNP